VNKQEVTIHRLSNGLTLVAEFHEDVSSAAFSMLVQAGAAYDPESRTGTAGVLTEWVFRGAGSDGNRELNQKLDSLGLHRNTGVNCLHTSLQGALVGSNLFQAIDLYANIIRRPQLAPQQFSPCLELALQALDSLEDDPNQKIAVIAQEKFFPYPIGRPACGKREELQALTADQAKDFWAETYRPGGAILAVAGKFELKKLVEQVEASFGDWQGEAAVLPPAGGYLQQYYHEPNQGAQVHVAVMYPSIGYGEPDFYRALTAVSVLSGGMGSRLFTEVREKRGLCYAVHASHRVIGPCGAVQCYLGSTPERAQEALDVTLGELHNLAKGVTQDELDRATVGLRASLIMQGESTSARASACARDYYYLKRVRSLDEIENAVRSLTVDEINDYLRRNPPRNFTIATLGPKNLDMPRDLYENH
jgi:predicted Zn-dependent peptidase